MQHLRQRVQQALGGADRALAEHRYADALAGYSSILDMGVEAWGIHVNVAQCHKRLGNLDEAFSHFERAFQIKRRPGAWQGFLPPQVAPQQIEPVNATHLTQLLEQLEYLSAQGKVTWYDDGIAAQLTAVRDKLLAGDPTASLTVWAKALTQLCAHRELSEVPDAIFNADMEIRHVPLSGAPGDGFYVLDNVLTPAAREALLTELLGSTYWFDARAERKYLGAHLHDGFATPFVLALAKAMQAKISELVGQVRAAQLWAFRYLEESKGIDIHADQGDWNLNIWPVDESNLLETGGQGGMTLYDIRIGEDIPFDQDNSRPDLNRSRIDAAGAAEHVVPYLGNRAVLFPSKYLHKTNAAQFADRHVGRRINVTMMSDRVEVPSN